MPCSGIAGTKIGEKYRNRLISSGASLFVKYILYICSLKRTGMKGNKINNIGIRTLLSWLWYSSRGARKQATLNIALGLTDVVCQLLWVLACKHAIDIATGVSDGSLAYTGTIIGALMLAEITSRGASRWIHAVTGNKVRNRMRLGIFARLLRCDWLHLQKHHTGDLVNRLEGDVNGITALITETIPATIVVLVQLTASFFLLFAMGPMLAVSIVVILPISLVASQFYVRRMRRLNRDVRDSDSRIQSVLQESLQHKELIKTLEQNDSTEKQLAELQEQLHTQVTDRTKFSLGAFTFVQLGFAAGYLVAFIWGVDSLHEGIITYGTMAAYLQLVGLIQRPTMDLSRHIPGIVSSLTAAERLYELEDMPLETEGKSIMLEGTAGVRFRKVGFRYEDKGRKILDNFSFDFAPNSSTAIIGETGTGKTTLIRLMVALVSPQDGDIEIYNRNGTYPSSTLTRGNFVYIPQGNSLVSGTIRDNLLMGNPDATEEQMKAALHMACADYVLELPDGMDSEVTERGGGLSEGQAQRIAIARSILRPGSILILDEITSALDEETEQELLKRLTQGQTGKTLIFVTHRPAIMEYCTQILKIDK